jgi:hypothetical protein
MREQEWDAVTLALGSPSSPMINISDPKVNWMSRGNFISKVQGAMVFPDGS